MTDYLAILSEKQVATWYRRLADRIGLELIENQVPLAAQFLRHWLDNRDPNSTFSFQAPNYLRQSSSVSSILCYHRDVFLSRLKARLTNGSSAWVGVIPRIQNVGGFDRWDLKKTLEMHYESLVEIGPNVFEINRIQLTGTPEEKDLLTALRGFQLKSRVIVRGTRLPNSKIKIYFDCWYCSVTDRYDFNYNEHFTVPNPDYLSKNTDAVRPQDRKITVYHKNAERIELAKLAAPYNVKSKEWQVKDARITIPTEVDPAIRL